MTIKKTIAVSVFSLISTYATAKGLTPSDQPLNDSYYVCFQTRLPVHSSRFGYPPFKQIHYKGCVITLDECLNHGKQKEKLHQFGWFNNYNDALSAFYRCAYS
jgi:hypothetical protein